MASSASFNAGTARASTVGAYSTAVSTFEGQLTKAEGIRHLHHTFEINRNSARDYLYVYEHLRDGRVFHRGLSAGDMEYFLSMILKDQGGAVLSIALNALWLHIQYYEGKRRVTLRSLRAIAGRYAKRVLEPRGLNDLENDLALEVTELMSLTTIEMDRRLKGAPTIPKKVAVSGYAFVRNPLVVARVLRRADGACESCKKKAPFLRRRDRTPYLEVHHKVQLAHGGEDSLTNAEALCPNCHRKAHFA